jgi:quercetin dioxygenase-like cupin family protein
MAFVVRRSTEVPWGRAAHSDAREVVLLSAAQGSVHMEVALSELAPGDTIAGHLHPFEESFYVLSGRALIAIDGQRHALVTGDFGFAPVATPHAWSNPYDEPVRWLRVRAPQPRRIGDVTGTYRNRDLPVPVDGRPVDEQDPRSRFVGHFAPIDLGAPGPLSMPGYHGHNIRDIAIRMMVDDILGAVHHTLFMVQFAPSDHGEEMLSAKEHFHPFEEIYYLVAGSARGTLDGQTVDVTAGDLIWMGTNSSHGFVNLGDEPVRWLEVQAPAPPRSHALIFEDDWKSLGQE